MEFAFITASNSEEILQANLLASPDVAVAETSIQRGAVSAGQAYSRGIAATRAEYMVFAHQDMFLPAGWLEKLKRTIAELEKADREWGVLGMFGVTASGSGEGHLYSTGLRRVLGTEFAGAREVETLDEIVLVLRRDSGLRFDEELPGFHLYGADICLEAQRHGWKCYAFSAFGLHNTNGIALLPRAYWRSYRYLHRKWRRRLPVMTPCMPVTPWHGPAVRYLIRYLASALRSSPKTGQRVANPAELLAGLPNRGPG